MKLSTPKKFAAGATLTLATCLLASCNAGASSTSSAGNAGSGTTGQSPSPSTAPVSETFTSPEYGYTVTLPAGWTVNDA